MEEKGGGSGAGWLLSRNAARGTRIPEFWNTVATLSFADYPEQTTRLQAFALVRRRV